jgi:hypothetical protein
MPIRANDVETLHDFAVGVMARAGRQTTQVRAIALAIQAASFGALIPAPSR